MREQILRFMQDCPGAGVGDPLHGEDGATQLGIKDSRRNIHIISFIV